MSTALALVSENPVVKELMDKLQESDMKSQYDNLSQLISYVDTMEKQLNTVLDELNGVKQQLDEIHDKRHPVRTACVKMHEALKSNVEEAKTRLNEVKSDIIEGAKNAAVAFKENGVSALNSVMSFFKVQNGLNSLRNSVDKSIASAEKSIAKIETMSSEIHAVGSHTRNIGRAMMGKETQQDVKENGKIMKMMQLPFCANKTTMNGMRKVVNASINKLEQLDKTVQQNREKAAAKEKKPSILQAVKNFKPPVKEAVGADKSKKPEHNL